MKKLFVIVFSFLVALIVAWYLKAAGANELVITTFISGIPFFLITAYETFRRWRIRGDKRVKEIIEDRIYRNPLSIVVYLVITVQFLKAIVALLGVTIASNSLQNFIGNLTPEIDRFLPLALGNAFGIVWPLLWLPLAYLAAQRIQHRPAVWVAVAVSVSYLIDIVLLLAWCILCAQQFLDGLSFWPNVWWNLLRYSLQLCTAIAGVWWAQDNHDAHRIRLLFRELSSKDRLALSELAWSTVSSVLNQKNQLDKGTEDHQRQRLIYRMSFLCLAAIINIWITISLIMSPNILLRLEQQIEMRGVRLNRHEKDFPTLRVSNKTVMPGCSTCWGAEVVARMDEEISFAIYYHNSGTEIARNVRAKILLPPRSRLEDPSEIIAQVIPENGDMAVGSVTVNFPTTASLIFNPVVEWYPKQVNEPQELHTGQYLGYSEIFDSGVDIGDIKPGWEWQGYVMVHALVMRKNPR